MKSSKKQYAMVIDSAKCIDCKACMVACKQSNAIPQGFWRNWVKSKDYWPTSTSNYHLHFQPGACMHCSEPFCVLACPTGATYKDPEDGIVKIDREVCIGCGNCIPACPYGARFRNPVTKQADKCDYCEQWRKIGLEPACVVTCPTKARVFGDINDPKSKAAKLLAENKERVIQVISEKTNTKPNMYYLGITAPVDWPVPAHVPGPMRSMINVLTPLLKTVVSMSAVGVGAMLAKQVFFSSKEAG